MKIRSSYVLDINIYVRSQAIRPNVTRLIQAALVRVVCGYDHPAPRLSGDVRCLASSQPLYGLSVKLPRQSRLGRGRYAAASMGTSSLNLSVTDLITEPFGQLRHAVYTSVVLSIPFTPVK